jgi:hypothetical protein
LANTDQVRRGDTIARSQRFPVPAEAESNGIKRIATLDLILTTANGLTLRRLTGTAIITINYLHTARRRARTGTQQSAQDKTTQQNTGTAGVTR